jgi:uncharacterized repeat protein (TIGR01451 family)
MSTKKLAFVFQSMVLVVAVYGNSAWAESAQKKTENEPVTVTLTLKRVVISANGKEKLEDAPKIKPGELLEYRAVYQNKSKTTIDGLTASLPVPVGLEYVKQSGKPAGVLATADDIKYAPEPLMRSVKDENGKEQPAEIPYVEYRALRWEVGDLDAGKKVEVSARMRAGEPPKSPEELVNKPAVPMLVK